MKGVKLMAYYETIDLHGETVESAGKKLCAKLKALPKDTRELVVIHGYHGGDKLQSIVRNFKHPKVERKILGINQGETVFIIENSYNKIT